MAYGAILGQRDRVLSVADVSPDNSGNIPLTAADISAQDVLTEDLTLTATSTLQSAIDSIPSKNLGGHTVTIKLISSTLANTSTSPCTIRGFYNGSISMVPYYSSAIITGDIIIKNCCNCPILFSNININGNRSNDAYNCVFEVRRSNVYMSNAEINGSGTKTQDGIKLLEGGTLSFTDGTINNCNNAINTQAASRDKTTGPVVTIYSVGSAGSNNNIGLKIWSGICYCLSDITFSATTTQRSKSGGLIVSPSGTLL